MSHSSRKKILFVITKSNFGGAQRYVFDVASSLPKDKYEVVVALGGNGVLISKLQQSHIPVIQIKSLERDVHIGKDLSVFFELIRIFRKEKPDVVHLNSSKIGGLGGLAGRIAGVPKIIFTAHGWAFNEQRSSFSKLIIKGVYLVTILLAHNTILVSEKMREQISKFPFIKNRITVIRNGIEKPELLFKAEALATFRKNPGVEQFLSQHPTPILVGTLAELHPIKGHRDAISAITLLDNPNLAYLIIGGGELEESLKTFVEEKGIKNVFFLGHLDQGGNYLGGLDYFLLPSHSEGLGYVLLEAGYAALPVIATDVGGIPEIIEDGKTGLLVPPKNPEAIKSSLEKLLQDQNMAQNIGKNLKEKVEKEFSFEEMIEKTSALY